MDKNQSHTPLLQLKGISKSFGGVQALSDVSLDLIPGQVVALVGDNGAGKSTLFNLISGRFVPSSGDILLHGQSIVGLRPFGINRLGWLASTL